MSTQAVLGRVEEKVDSTASSIKSLLPVHSAVQNTRNLQPDMAEDEDNEDDEESMESQSESEKDEAELELEKLVFGDDVGFRTAVNGYADHDSSDIEGEDEGDEDGDEALATVADADLFFLDAGPTTSADTLLEPSDDQDKEVYHRGPPAWEDSDDERMQISLMAVPRLRKLRNFEGEDIINGKEYARRLRRQYELLHPRPAWASWSPAKTKDGDNSDSDSDGGDTMDLDISAQPLAKLLRSGSALTRTTTKSLSSKRIKLRSQAIGISRLPDILPTQPHNITNISIHPTLPLILSSGLSSTIFLHHLQPSPIPPLPANPMLTSLNLAHTPLTTSAFSPSTSEPTIYLSSRRHYFHTWNLSTGTIQKTTQLTTSSSTYGKASIKNAKFLKPSPCGRYIAIRGSNQHDSIHLLSSTTLQWLAEPGAGLEEIIDFNWWGDGEGMCIVTRRGELCEWSSAKQALVRRWNDEAGGVGTTVLALGGQLPPTSTSAQAKSSPKYCGPDAYTIIGSTSGIVMIYARDALSSQSPLPADTNTNITKPQNSKPALLATLDNLITPITSLSISPCGQLLCMASSHKKGALRLVHLPSCTVYKNWPTVKTVMGRVYAVALGETVVPSTSTGKDSDIDNPNSTKVGQTRGFASSSQVEKRNSSSNTHNSGDAASETRSLVLVTGNDKGIMKAWNIYG